MNKTIWGLLFFVLLCTVILWLFSNIVIYILVSLVLTTILRPVTDYLDNIEVFGVGIPRILAVLMSFAILVAVFVLLILLFQPLVAAQVEVIRHLNYLEMTENIKAPLLFVEKNILQGLFTGQKEGYLFEQLQQTVNEFIGNIDLGKVLNYAVLFTGRIFVYMIAISFMTFFFLYEKGLIRKRLLSFLPNSYFEVVITSVYKIELLLSSYLLGLLIQVSIFFILISLGLTIFGIKYALTIAVFAATINLIPYLGPAIGFLFTLFVVFSTQQLEQEGASFVYAMLKVIPVFAITIFFDNLFVQPYIFSKSVKAHPLEIFIAIFAGATLAGPPGMIAAIPVYTTFRVLFIELRTGFKEYRIFKVSGE